MHNVWPNGYTFFSPKSTTVRPTIVPITEHCPTCTRNGAASLLRVRSLAALSPVDRFRGVAGPRPPLVALAAPAAAAGAAVQEGAAAAAGRGDAGGPAGPGGPFSVHWKRSF